MREVGLAIERGECAALFRCEIAHVDDPAEPLAIAHFDHGRRRAHQALEARAIELAANPLEHERCRVARQPDPLRRRLDIGHDVIGAVIPAEQRIDDVLDVAAHGRTACRSRRIDQDLAIGAPTRRPRSDSVRTRRVILPSRTRAHHPISGSLTRIPACPIEEHDLLDVADPEPTRPVEPAQTSSRAPSRHRRRRAFCRCSRPFTDLAIPRARRRHDVARVRPATTGLRSR